MRRRVLGFISLPAASLIASLLVLPILARVGGEPGWVAVAIGQSIGAFGGIFIMYGWGLTGPSEIARAPDPDRSHIYALSLSTRVLTSFVAIPVVAAIAWILAPHDSEAVAALMAVAVALGGFSPIWYCVGMGNPWSAALFDTAPRIAATVAGAGVMMATHEVIYYPIVTIVATVIGTSVFSMRTTTWHDINAISSASIALRLRQSRAAALTELSAGAYASLPVVLVSLVAPVSAVATYASGERLYRIGMMAISAFSNAFQGWVAESQAGSVSRMRRSLATHLALGIAGFAGFALVAPIMSALLFGDGLAVDQVTAVWFGAAFLGVSVNTSLGRHILVPRNRTPVVLQSTLAGALVGVPAILIGASVGGSGGASLGLAISQAVVCTVQVWALRASAMFWWRD